MSNQNTVNVQLTVKDDGSVVMKQFGQTTEEAMGKASKSATKTTGNFDALKTSYIDMAAKATTAYMAVTKAMEYMDKGAGATQAEASFKTLTAAAGESADAIISEMKRATNSTIDDSQMMQKAAKAELLEFTGEQIEQMAEMSRMAARTSGDSVGVAFDTIVDAISTNMPKALKRYGLMTKEQMGIINQAMAEGVTDVNLYSIATANMVEQQSKMGPLLENDAEKMQQYRVQLEETKESFGKLLLVATNWLQTNLSEGLSNFTVIAAAIASGSTAPFDRWAEEKVGIKEVEEELARYQARLKSAQKGKQDSGLGALNEAARKKSELETMKALDKDYFTAQESTLKSWTEIQKATGADEYLIAQETIKKREALNTEFYDRTKREIELEAATRSKADRDKITDAAYVAQKIQALDAETTTKNKSLMQERTQAAITAANNDIKNLQSRLSDYQSYYDSLKAKMDKNIEDEKKHIEQLKTLRQQSADLDKSTASMIAGIKGTSTSNTLASYGSSRSALNSQYGSALNLGGQDEIKALEEYKQAVAALQSQFSQGIPGTKDIFGNTNDILSAKTIAEDAISDIERATQNQKNALVELEAQTQSQIEADQQWGQTLQTEMQAAQAQIENISSLIADISDQIMNMQTNITLTADDQMSSVVSGIISQIEKLHDLAVQPFSIGGGSYSGSSSSFSTSSIGSDGFSDIPFALNTGSAVIDSYADGTNYVPRTGLYKLHQGESVTPAAENNGGSRSITVGAININIPENAAPQSASDWRDIVRNYIVPEMKKLHA